MEGILKTKKRQARKPRKPMLTQRQQQFALQYLIDLNGRAAAERAGYSAKIAAKAACLNLQKPAVKALIDEELEKQRERTLVTADQVLLDIQRVGRKAEKAEDWAQALRASELIGKRYKLFTDKVEVVNSTPRAERLREARLRRQQKAAEQA